MLKIFGAVGSGSVPIEVTLRLLGIPHEVIVRRVDADPRLKEFWAKRFPFHEGWER